MSSPNNESDARTHPFWPTAAIFRVVSSLRFCRGEHPLGGSREAVTETFADSVGGAPTCPAGIRPRVASPDRFDEAGRLPVSGVRRNGFANPVCDWRRLVASLLPRCSLRRRPVVDAAFHPAAFDMRYNWRPAPQNRRRLSPSRNEVVPELLLAVR